ncbi:efflux RND transporter periplasmic adaptor subunit [Alkalihalobacillus sp. AL-G]|uniref:efflux RND transporter periplasmic adaptor subunit n=1 Tax=Alkalihalobacillus sp. AL-G TaxID=2926399 RepID=UPI00272AA9F1|nr:efflux RND transporter periplasmic adaptor subunit [Alkalihalobacillus sp. AL-G]WLD94842.1 efflux RND transporter periplasmic adaptor subunit [Alkalihalobacillus sp. AL-G]
MNRYIKRGLIGLPVILFIIINMYLFILDHTLFAREKPYDVVTIDKRDLKKGIETTGVIVPLEKQEIYNEPYRGEIEEILVQVGDQVNAGTAIIEYQSSEIENEIARLEDEITELETEQDYYEDRAVLISTQISQESSKEDDEKNQSTIYLLEQEEAEAEYQAEQAEDMIDSKENEIDRLEELQEDKTVDSSISGIVKKINPNGASSQEPIVTIVSENNVIARAYLSEQDMFLLKESDPVTIQSGYKEEIEWAGSVLAIGTPVEKEGEKLYPVDISLESDSEKQLPLGSTVKIVMNPVAVMDAVAVKEESIMHVDGDDYVLVVKKDYIDKRKVTFGYKNEPYQQITKGLKAGETIVKQPNRLLVDTMEIETEKKKEKKDKKDQDTPEKENDGNNAVGNEQGTDSDPSADIPDANEDENQ